MFDPQGAYDNAIPVARRKEPSSSRRGSAILFVVGLALLIPEETRKGGMVLLALGALWALLRKPSPAASVDQEREYVLPGQNVRVEINAN